MSIFRFDRRFPPSKGTWQKLLAAVEHSSNINSDGSITVIETADGTTLALTPQEVFDASITANYGDASYAWQKVYQTIDGTFTTDPADSAPMVGGASISARYAWECNGNRNVPVGTIVHLRAHFLRDDSEEMEYEFDYCCSGGPAASTIPPALYSGDDPYGCCGDGQTYVPGGGSTADRRQTISTATISSSQNNYPLWPGDILYANVTSASDLTGITAGQDGEMVEIQNVGSAILTLKDSSGSSSSASQIDTYDGSDRPLKPKQTVALKYNLAATKWYVLWTTDGDIGCRVKHSAAATISSGGVAAALAFDQEDYDTDTMHTTGGSNSRITFTTPGKYLVWFNCKISMASAPSDGSYWEFNLYKGGAAVKGISTGVFGKSTPATGNATTYYNGSPIIVIEDVYAAADYVEIFAANNDSTTNASVTGQVFGARKTDHAG